MNRGSGRLGAQPSSGTSMNAKTFQLYDLRSLHDHGRLREGRGPLVVAPGVSAPSTAAPIRYLTKAISTRRVSRVRWWYQCDRGLVAAAPVQPVPRPAGWGWVTRAAAVSGPACGPPNAWRSPTRCAAGSGSPPRRRTCPPAATARSARSTAAAIQQFSALPALQRGTYSGGSSRLRFAVFTHA